MASFKSLFYFLAFNANMSIGSIIFGYFLTVYNPLMNQIDYLNNWQDPSDKSTFEGILTSVIPLGGAFGSLISPFFINRMGRKYTCLISDIICVIGSLSSLINSFPALLIGRFICGIYIGLNSNLVPIYLREINPLEISDYLGGLFNLMLNLGILMAFLFGLNTIRNAELLAGKQDNWWRFMFGFPIITIVRSILLFAVFRSESPFHLLMKNKENECLEFFKQHYNEEFVNTLFTSLKKRVKKTKSKSEPNLTTEIFSRRYFKRFCIGLMLVFICQFSGINAVGFYSTKLFTLYGESDTTANYLNGGYSVFGILVSMFLGFFLKHFGIKKTYCANLFLCGSSLVGIAAFSYAGINIGTLIMIFSFNGFFNLGAGPLIFLIIPQILPGKLVGLTFFIYWIFAFLVGLLFPKMIDSPMGIEGSFLFFGGCVFLGFVFNLIYLEETKGMNNEEISALYRKLIRENEEIENDKEEELEVEKK